MNFDFGLTCFVKQVTQFCSLIYGEHHFHYFTMRLNTSGLFRILLITRVIKDQSYKVYKTNLFRVIPGDNTGAVVEVTGVGEGGQRPHRVVAGELGETLHEVIQLVQVPAFI